MHFKQTEQGYWIGYHWEGCETFQLAGAIRLSMESLDNARPLFIMHLPDSGWVSGRLYEITFRPLKKYQAMDREEFDCLLDYSDAEGWSPTDTLLELEGKGHRLMWMATDDRRDTEAFIWQPKDAVVAIRDITVDFTVPGITKLFTAINN